MADRPGHSGPTPPPYRVDGQLADQKPPQADRRPVAGLERPLEGDRPVVVYGAAQTRPAFPRRPLDPACLEPSDLPTDQRAEVVSLVRLIQTDFDPEIDPRGWDSVAEIVRGIHPEDTVRRMDYPTLVAFFRVRHGQLKIQLGGTIETNTPSIVSYNAAPPAQARPLGHSTKTIDVDGPLGKIETKMRKVLVAELGSEAAAAAALVDKLYSLSAEDLEPMLRKMGCKASAKTISRSDKYAAWGRYRHPTPAPPPAVDVGPAALRHVRPSAADLAADAESSGHVSKRVGGRGTTHIGKTAAEKAAEDAADRFAREAGIDLPPAE